jgi:hypothetical protein
MTFCCNVTTLEAKVFIISRRSSLDDPITLKFVNAGAVSLDNSIGVEIHGTVDLDFLVEMGSHSVSSNDLSIRDCICWKRDHTYARVIH